MSSLNTQKCLRSCHHEINQFFLLYHFFYAVKLAGDEGWPAKCSATNIVCWKDSFRNKVLIQSDGRIVYPSHAVAYLTPYSVKLNVPQLQNCVFKTAEYGSVCKCLSVELFYRPVVVYKRWNYSLRQYQHLLQIIVFIFRISIRLTKMDVIYPFSLTDFKLRALDFLLVLQLPENNVKQEWRKERFN